MRMQVVLIYYDINTSSYIINKVVSKNKNCHPSGKPHLLHLCRSRPFAVKRLQLLDLRLTAKVNAVREISGLERGLRMKDINIFQVFPQVFPFIGPQYTQ